MLGMFWVFEWIPKRSLRFRTGWHTLTVLTFPFRMVDFLSRRDTRICKFRGHTLRNCLLFSFCFFSFVCLLYSVLSWSSRLLCVRAGSAFGPSNKKKSEYVRWISRHHRKHTVTRGTHRRSLFRRARRSFAISDIRVTWGGVVAWGVGLSTSTFGLLFVSSTFLHAFDLYSPVFFAIFFCLLSRSLWAYGHRDVLCVDG